MSILTYNGVCLPYPMTTRFNQQVVYDDSHTDWMCTKFDIQVQAMLNVNYMSTIYPDYRSSENPDNAGAIMNAIRVLLLRPRRPLSFKVNDVEMIPGKAGVSGDVDVRNGPQPIDCQIKQLTDVTFMISYHIQAHYWENTTISLPDLTRTNRAGSPVLSNRWSEMVEYDNRMVATKTREGKYVIRSDNDKGKIADALRTTMAVVGLAPGFIRQSSRYRVDPSGLAIEYSVTDKQVFKYPPEGVYEATGSYTESTLRQGGAYRIGRVELKLKGGFQTSQDALLQKAYSMALKKLTIREAPGSAIQSIASIWKSIMFMVVRIDMFDNVVEVAAQARFTNTGNERADGVHAFAGDGSMTFTPDSDNSGAKAPDYSGRGSSNILLQAARYYDPSLADNKLAEGDPFVSFDDVAVGKQNNLNHGRAVGTAGVNRET